jgi:hypothetical protein
MPLLRFAIAGLTFTALLWSASSDPVLLASRRAGSIEVINVDTLETTSRIKFSGSVESVASDPSGRQLFVALPLRDQAKGCCALYALELPSLRLTFLAEPALRAVPTTERVVFQRGNAGIESFDAHSLVRLPTIQTPGVYRMQISPDGRWLFGTTSFQGASLDLFDLSQGKMVWQHPVDGDTNLDGVWVGQHYYLVSANRGGHGQLWSVAPDNPELRDPISLSLPNTAVKRCEPVMRSLLAAGDRVVIYDLFGDKLDQQHDCPRALGGFVVVNPKTGAASARLAPTDHFRQLISSADGRYLYGLDVGEIGWTRVRIVKLDTAAGTIISSKNLEDDVWFLTSGKIPSEMEGRLDLAAAVR